MLNSRTRKNNTTPKTYATKEIESRFYHCVFMFDEIYIYINHNIFLTYNKFGKSLHLINLIIIR